RLCWSVSRLFAPVDSKIERKETFVVVGALENVGVAQCAASVVVAGAPMLFHTEPRELVILGVTLVVPGAVYELNDVVDLTVRGGAEQLCVRRIPQIVRQLLKQAGSRAPQFLNVPELVRPG